MIYIFIYIIGILLGLLNDFILSNYLSNYSSVITIFISNIFIFLVSYFIHKKIEINRNIIIRSFIILSAYLCTFLTYKATTNITNISAMWYFIPVFQTILFKIFFKKKFDYISIIFSLTCIFMFFNKNIPILAFIGCFLFALSDIFLVQYKSENHFLVELGSISFFISIFLLPILIYKLYTTTIIFSKFIYIYPLVNFCHLYFLLYALKYGNIIRLAPFKFIDLICSNIILRTKYKQSFILVIFMIIRFFK